MSTISQWVTDLIKLLYDFTVSIGIPSYGLAIILMTIIIKTILYPLTWKQLVTVRKTQKLAPKIKEIQDKYKNDPQKANMKVMELYREHNANPLSGCLPLLLQFPIFVALYRALLNFPYSGEATFFGISLTAKNAIILAILAALTTFLQSKVSMVNTGNVDPDKKASVDPTQKTMLYIMPIFMGYISYTVPAGLALYWVTMNVMSILQQLLTNFILDRQEQKANAV